MEALKTAVAQRSPMISSLLEHASAIRPSSEAGMEIQFARHDRFSCEMLQSVENLALLQEIAESIAGKPHSVRVVLESGACAETPEPQPEASASTAKKELLDRAKQDAGVKAFLDAFRGEISDVKDLKQDGSPEKNDSGR
jgi:hypothetical protein